MALKYFFYLPVYKKDRLTGSCHRNIVQIFVHIQNCLQWLSMVSDGNLAQSHLVMPGIEFGTFCMESMCSLFIIESVFVLSLFLMGSSSYFSLYSLFLNWTSLPPLHFHRAIHSPWKQWGDVGDFYSAWVGSNQRTLESMWVYTSVMNTLFF